MASHSATTKLKLYHLIFSEDEIRTLIKIMQNIGGCLYKSPRKHTETILTAIYATDLKPMKSIISFDSDALYFEDS